MDAERVGHVIERAREGALRLLHHSIQRWTAPAPQASRPAWQVHRWKTFSAKNRRPRRASQTYKRNGGRRALAQTTAWTQSPVLVRKLVSQRPRPAAANASSLLVFLFSKRLDLGQQTPLNRARR